MPILHEFDTQAEQAPGDQIPDNQKTLEFSLVARPRLPNGFRELDFDKKGGIRVKTILQYFTKEWADCHITTWDDTELYSGVEDVLVLRPADTDFLFGEHMRNLLVTPDDPSAVRVNFDRPFITKPKVEVFLNYLDLDNKKNWRVKTFASDIDVNGFTINIETWGDTILYAAQACWVAYPEDRTHIFSASVNTSEIRPWNQPQLQNSKAITFGNVEFWKDPTVFIALNYIDIDCKANFRINAHVDNVSRTGLTWHLDSWADTVLYGAGASIIAFNP